ncbi:MAG: HAD family hydrolase [Xenococcaceae cyanobacterium]
MNDTKQSTGGYRLPSRIQEQLRILIFDLDGVITSEKKYWNTARLTVWELISSENYLGLSNYFGESSDVSTRLLQVGERVISNSFIYKLKSRAINSNWDLTFFVICLHLVGILSKFSQVQPDSWSNILSKDDIPIGEKLHRVGRLLQGHEYDDRISNAVIERFWEETLSLTGAAVLEYVTSFTNRILGVNLPSFEPKGDLWQLCYSNFQDWYEGKKGYSLPDDETVLELTSIDAALRALHNSGQYTLAIATGRPRVEVIQPMTALGLLQYFDPKRIVTYDEVLEAESILSHSDRKIKLGKPHPFVLFKAIHPDEDVEILCAEEFQLVDARKVAYIGDAGSDVVAAKQAGCVAIGVLTGFAEGKARDNKRKMLKDLGCDVILNSVLELPQLLGEGIH